MDGLEHPAPEVALFCSYVPFELVRAAGFRPRFVTGLESNRTDPRLAQNLCPYVRRCSAWLDESAGELAAAVVTDSCYPMQRLGDQLEAAAKTPVHRLLVPRLSSGEAVRFFHHELERLAAGLAGLPGACWSPDRLEEEMAVSSDVRRLLDDVHALIREGRLEGSLPYLSELVGRMLFADPAALRDELRRMVDGAGERAPAGHRKPRLLVTGSHFISPELLSTLEGMGFRIAQADSCEHHRSVTGIRFDDGGDPLLRLARGYLFKPACPRMNDGRDRIRRLAEEARTGAFDGVLIVLTKSCTLHAYDVPVWRDVMKPFGIPVMLVETQDGDWSQGRVLTRFEAFLESIEAARRAR